MRIPFFLYILLSAILLTSCGEIGNEPEVPVDEPDMSYIYVTVNYPDTIFSGKYYCWDASLRHSYNGKDFTVIHKGYPEEVKSGRQIVKIEVVLRGQYMNSPYDSYLKQLRAWKEFYVEKGDTAYIVLDNFEDYKGY